MLHSGQVDGLLAGFFGAKTWTAASGRVAESKTRQSYDSTSDLARTSTRFLLKESSTDGGLSYNALLKGGLVNLAGMPIDGALQEDCLNIWSQPIHFALGMAWRCQFLEQRVKTHADTIREYFKLFEDAATELLDECNDRYEVEKVLLNRGRHFTQYENPLNFALRYRMIGFINNSWVKRYGDELWFSIGEGVTSTTEMDCKPVIESMRKWYSRSLVTIVVGQIVLVVASVLSLLLFLPILYLIQICVGPNRKFKKWRCCVCCWTIHPNQEVDGSIKNEEQERDDLQKQLLQMHSVNELLQQVMDQSGISRAQRRSLKLLVVETQRLQTQIDPNDDVDVIEDSNAGDKEQLHKQVSPADLAKLKLARAVADAKVCQNRVEWVYPGRWNRRLCCMLQFIWSTAMMKFWAHLWSYLFFLFLMIRIARRQPSFMNAPSYAEGINWISSNELGKMFAEADWEIIGVWMYGVAWFVAELSELYNRSASRSKSQSAQMRGERLRRREKQLKDFKDFKDSGMLAMADRVFDSSAGRFARWRRALSLSLDTVLRSHYGSVWNWLDAILIVLIALHFIVLSPVDLGSINDDILARTLLAFIALFAWFRMLGMMKIHKTLGPLVQIFGRMVGGPLISFIYIALVIMGAFGNALMIVHHENRDIGLTAGGMIYRQFMVLLEKEDESAEIDRRDALECYESQGNLLSGGSAGTVCREVFIKDTLQQVYVFTVVVILLNLLIAMLSRKYEEIADESHQEWILLLTQTTIEYSENVLHIGQLAPYNLLLLPFRMLGFARWIVSPLRWLLLRCLYTRTHRCRCAGCCVSR